MKRLNGNSLSCNSGVKNVIYCGGAVCLAPLSIQETLSVFAH